MATNNETGHAKNVAAFEDLISYCIGYGAAYNPSKNSIKITQQQALLAAARANLVSVNTAATTYSNAVNARVMVFAGIRKLSTRLLNAFIASGASSEAVADAKGINRKIQGVRASLVPESPILPPAEDGTIPIPPVRVRTASSSQRSYDNLIEHLSRMALLLNTEPLYLPNENELKVTALNALVANLRTANTAVINATTAVSNARIARNATLYHPTAGLCEIAKEVKVYVKSVFGATSPQYKQLAGITFKASAL